jgi:hypothetical protein
VTTLAARQLSNLLRSHFLNCVIAFHIRTTFVDRISGIDLFGLDTMRFGEFECKVNRPSSVDYCAINSPLTDFKWGSSHFPHLEFPHAIWDYIISEVVLKFPQVRSRMLTNSDTCYAGCGGGARGLIRRSHSLAYGYMKMIPIVVPSFGAVSGGAAPCTVPCMINLKVLQTTRREIHTGIISHHRPVQPPAHNPIA